MNKPSAEIGIKVEMNQINGPQQAIESLQEQWRSKITNKNDFKLSFSTYK